MHCWDTSQVPNDITPHLLIQYCTLLKRQKKDEVYRIQRFRGYCDFQIALNKINKRMREEIEKKMDRNTLTNKKRTFFL